MAETTAFELVSPERLLVSKDVEMVVVPGAEGYFGVLPRHAPMISTLNAGVIDIHQGGQVGERIFIAGGFAVLAEEAMPVGEIDPAAVNQEIANLSHELKDRASGPETARLSQRIQMLEAKVAAVA